LNRKLWTLLGVLVLAIATLASPLAAAETAAPGEPITLNQTIPVNIVFVGYEEDDLDVADLESMLPATADPLVRYPEFYGVSGRELGLLFHFDHRLHWASQGFEDQFFGYLGSAGGTADPTDFQLMYNDQLGNVLDVTGPVRYIDGPATERVLSQMAQSHLGIDTRRSYTIFFVNWYGREDFQFHVYTKTDEPDPDTGYNFGELRASRKMIAWGGTSSRTWFYDLSAGPEAWTDNWNVDDPDLDGNGVEDYRMPAIWEYADGGYRAPSELGSDLGKVARFVAIDLLFASSPLYDPLVTTPGLNGSKVAHIEMFEDDATSSGLDWIDTGYIYNELAGFEPYYPWQVALEDNNPIDFGAKMALGIAGSPNPHPDCWVEFGDPFAQFFCYFDANLATYVPPYAPNDYVIEVFAYNTTPRSLGLLDGLLGFADDNWVDGTQTYVFEFLTRTYRELGYGFSTTTVHEVGHHLGMSHPHDGYDSELGIDFGPADEFYYAWSGDESDSVMSYLGVSNSFGVFDRDNMYRYEAAGYVNLANELLGAILAHPDAGSVQNLTNAATQAINRATVQFGAWSYLNSATTAYGAYTLALAAAEQLGIESASLARLAAVGDGSAPHEADPIRFPDN
jgi:hypothetical protein